MRLGTTDCRFFLRAREGDSHYLCILASHGGGGGDGSKKRRLTLDTSDLLIESRFSVGRTDGLSCLCLKHFKPSGSGGSAMFNCTTWMETIAASPMTRCKNRAR